MLYITPISSGLAETSRACLMIVLMATVAAILLGVFLLTAQEPRDYLAEQVATTRRLARGFTIAGVAAFVARFGLFPYFRPGLMGVACNILIVFSLVTTLAHAERLIRRIPDDRLVRSLSQWRLGLLWTGLACWSTWAWMYLLPAGGTLWSIVTTFAAVFLCVYAVILLVAIGLFVGLAAALANPAQLRGLS